MAQRNEHVVAIMLEPVKIGQEFIEWPLHITLAPWFPCDDEPKLDKILAQIAKDHKSFSITIGGVQKFGSKKDVPVNVVRDNAQLVELHWKIFNALDKSGFPIHQREYVGGGYQAHVTHQVHGKKKSGEKLAIGSFTLVKQIRLKKTGTMVKTIAKTYELG